MAKEDIVLGSGTLWYAATGTANPDETTVAYGAAWGGTWASLGQTLTPMVFSFGEARRQVKTQQSLGVLKEFRTALNPTVKTTLAELTGANLALILQGVNTATAAGAAQKAVSSIAIGADPLVTVKKFGFETMRVDAAGGKQPVRFFFHIASIMADGDSAFDKENETGWPITLTVHQDTSQSAGSEFMLIEIVTAPVTA